MDEELVAHGAPAVRGQRRRHGERGRGGQRTRGEQQRHRRNAGGLPPA